MPYPQYSISVQMEAADDQLRPVTGADATRKSESSMRNAEGTMLERAQEPEQHDPNPQPQYPSPAKFCMALTTLCLGILLITLDSTFVATAIPYITDEFQSLKDVGWYGSIYRMTLCISHLLFGKLAARYSVYWVYSSAMLIFLVGSTICGVAPDSPTFIAGRAIAGLGSSGLLITAYSLVPILAPSDKRALSLSTMWMARSIAATAGPLVSEALAQGASWRWAFYINLSLGAVLYVVSRLFIQPPASLIPAFTSFPDLMRTLDLIGLAALVPTVVCLLLALQWGGISYSWTDGRIIALLVVTGVLGLTFIALEFWQGEKAMLPSRIFTQSFVLYASLYGFCSSGAIYVLTYYIPEWFQDVKGASPLMSAVYTLPWLIASVITLLGCGALISKTGHVEIWMLIGTVFGAVGSGLFTTFTPDTRPGKWVGYQIIFSIGSSLFSVTPLIIVQSQLALKDIAIGSGMVAFSQAMGSLIFVSIAQVTFTNNLASGLQQLGIQGLHGTLVTPTGLTGFSNALSGDLKKAVLTVINDSLVDSWRPPIVLTCVSLVGALGVKYHKRN